jgi:hypothetical protein
MIKATIHIENHEELFDKEVSIDVVLIAVPRKGERLFLDPIYSKRLEELAARIHSNTQTEHGHPEDDNAYFDWLVYKEEFGTDKKRWQIDFKEADVVCEVGYRTNSIGKDPSVHIELTHYDRYTK